jgi:hypothetical protein
MEEIIDIVLPADSELIHISQIVCGGYVLRSRRRIHSRYWELDQRAESMSVISINRLYPTKKRFH